MSAMPGWDDHDIAQHATALDLYADQITGSYTGLAARCGAAAIRHCMALTRPSATPRTELVEVGDALGRQWIGGGCITSVHWHRHAPLTLYIERDLGILEMPTHPDNDGMVEVLIEDET